MDRATTQPRPPIAAALEEAFRVGDPGPLLALLAPGAVLWHNSDHVETDAATGFEGVRGLHRLVEGLHLEILQAVELPDGELVRFVVRGTVRANGTELAAHNCAVFTTDAERVHRLDEYVDPTFSEQLGL